LFSDQINIVIVEMSKLGDAVRRPAEDLTQLELWSLFFRFAPDPKYRDLVNNIINKNKEIGMAATLLMEISQDEHERAKFRSRRKAETDRYSDIATSRERGRLEANLETAKNLRTMGMSVEDTAKATGLTVDEVLRLS